MIRASNCPLCKHFQGGRGKPWVCTAFPLGIPDLIALGKEPHTEPFPGDGGVRFEAKESQLLTNEQICEMTPEALAGELNILLGSATELWRAANSFREDKIIVTKRNR